MLHLDVSVGQAVQIGDVAVVKVMKRSGQRVRLAFYTSVAPITLLSAGVIPERFSIGITGERRPAPTLAYG